ncbi:hypothetical protein BurMR1_1888 [Burkholderia sp. MR1]|nr:hypothetical protein BurMR1_1888 [Burkholderia sp. MR1]
MILQLIVVLSGAVLILAGLGLVCFQIWHESRGRQWKLRLGSQMPHVKISTNYSGVVVILLGAAPEAVGVFGFPH